LLVNQDHGDSIAILVVRTAQRLRLPACGAPSTSAVHSSLAAGRCVSILLSKSARFLGDSQSKTAASKDATAAAPQPRPEDAVEQRAALAHGGVLRRQPDREIAPPADLGRVVAKNIVIRTDR
jgi:hypothetical protein